MPEIGDVLRERRMALKVDVQEVEESTKIRAKYLRALENEEYNLLPGPAYVKSFLRTYADHLGLDGRGLVDTYKKRHETRDDDHLPLAGRIEARGGGGSFASRRWVLVVVVILLLLAIFFVVGSIGGDAGAVS